VMRVRLDAPPRSGFRMPLVAGALPLTLLVGTAAAWTQTPPQPAQPPPPQAAPAPPPGLPKGVDLPTDYVVGPDDALAVMFWREKDLSAEVVVRPDGMISLPLLNDIQAAGLSVEQLRQRVMEAASRYVQDPSATVVVKAINSRNAFITGMVAKPGPYPLTNATTVMQLIARAGGLLEYANESNITILRTDGGQTRSFKFNYKEVAEGKKLQQNIQLKPGDTVIVR